MRKAAMALTLAMLAGCATLKDFEHELGKTDGLPEASLVDALGQPTEKVMGKKGYRLAWVRRDSAKDFCVLNIVMDDGKAVRHEWQGTSRGCRPYAKALQAKFGTDEFSLPD